MTFCRIYRDYEHFLLQLVALSAHPKTPQSRPAVWAEGVTDCPQGVWALRERGHEPRASLLTARCCATENDAEQHLHFYTERNGAQRPHKESIRYCKRMQNKGGAHAHRISKGEEKGRSIFSQGWLLSPPQLSQG